MVVGDEVTVLVGVDVAVVVVGVVDGEVVTVVVAEVVGEVVGDVCSQSANVPSKNEAVAWFSTSAIAAQPLSAFKASPMVHATASSTDPREYSVTTPLITFCDALQLSGSTSVTLPFTAAPHPRSTVSPPLHVDSISLMRTVCNSQNAFDGSVR